MVPGATSAQQAELEEFVEAYEVVRARDAGADLTTFLPVRGHPLYMIALCEFVRIDLEFSWRGGQPRRLEEYEARFPELFRDRGQVQEIAFEEYRLRRQLGDNPSPDEYKLRWGVGAEHWPGSEAAAENGGRDGSSGQPPSRVTDGILSLANASTDMPYPEAGDAFLDFQLLAELGRGTFGRVYLARQKGLFGRHVVLKVATNISLEARILVQLQHTNIVPVYSVHQARPLHALCMPFLGATTLAEVLKDLHGRKSLPQSGKGLVDTATACLSATRQGFASRGVPVSDSNEGGTDAAAGAARVYWTHLEQLTFVQAVLWLGARLADGLAHAHDRGILHRDLKPANVLLTEEGQPMLLDFNLSEDVKLSPGLTAAFVGGTLPYMAPERLRAFRQGRSGAGAPSDIYSLGVILYELLTGRQPFPVRAGPVEIVLDEMVLDRRGAPPRLRAWNRRSRQPSSRSFAIALSRTQTDATSRPASYRKTSSGTWRIGRCGTRPRSLGSSGWRNGLGATRGLPWPPWGVSHWPSSPG
jgi:serine/threonine protein kinase